MKTIDDTHRACAHTGQCKSYQIVGCFTWTNVKLQGMLLSCCHPHTLTFPFPSPLSDLRKTKPDMWGGMPQGHDGLLEWTRQLHPHPPGHHLILAHRCEVFNPYVLFPFLRQPPFLLPKKDSGPFSNNFQILIQHMQNISEPEWIHKIFLETVRFYRLAQASRSVSSM